MYLRRVNTNESFSLTQRTELFRLCHAMLQRLIAEFTMRSTTALSSSSSIPTLERIAEELLLRIPCGVLTEEQSQQIIQTILSERLTLERTVQESVASVLSDNHQKSLILLVHTLCGVRPVSWLSLFTPQQLRTLLHLAALHPLLDPIVYAIVRTLLTNCDVVRHNNYTMWTTILTENMMELSTAFVTHPTRLRLRILKWLCLALPEWCHCIFKTLVTCHHHKRTQSVFDYIPLIDTLLQSAECTRDFDNSFHQWIQELLDEIWTRVEKNEIISHRSLQHIVRLMCRVWKNQTSSLSIDSLTSRITTLLGRVSQQPTLLRLISALLNTLSESTLLHHLRRVWSMWMDVLCRVMRSRDGTPTQEEEEEFLTPMLPHLQLLCGVLFQSKSVSRTFRQLTVLCEVALDSHTPLPHFHYKVLSSVVQSVLVKFHATLSTTSLPTSTASTVLDSIHRMLSRVVSHSSFLDLLVFVHTTLSLTLRLLRCDNALVLSAAHVDTYVTLAKTLRSHHDCSLTFQARLMTRLYFLLDMLAIHLSSATHFPLHNIITLQQTLHHTTTLQDDTLPFDSARLRYSIRHFPYSRALLHSSDTEIVVPPESEEIEDYKCVEDAAECVDLNRVYDPVIVLPLSANILMQCERLVTTQISVVTGVMHRFLDSGLVSYLIVSLSAHTVEMRRLAAAQLTILTTLLSSDTIRIRERTQILLLLRSLKNALTESVDIRLPNFVTLFLALAVLILQRPDHTMYRRINETLLKRPFLVLDEVPLFRKLLNSATPSHQRERDWLLHLIFYSIHTEQELKIIAHKQILSKLLSYAACSSCPSSHYILVLRIVARLLTVWQQSQSPSAFMNWVQYEGLLTWLDDQFTTQHDLSISAHNVLFPPLLATLRSVKKSLLFLSPSLVPSLYNLTQHILLHWIHTPPHFVQEVESGLVLTELLSTSCRETPPFNSSALDILFISLERRFPQLLQQQWPRVVNLLIHHNLSLRNQRNVLRYILWILYHSLTWRLRCLSSFSHSIFDDTPFIDFFTWLTSIFKDYPALVSQLCAKDPHFLKVINHWRYFLHLFPHAAQLNTLLLTLISQLSSQTSIVANSQQYVPTLPQSQTK